MVDNIHLTPELLRNYNRKRVFPRWLAKVDIRKAYDSVGWHFLRSILNGLGFCNDPPPGAPCTKRIRERVIIEMISNNGAPTTHT